MCAEKIRVSEQPGDPVPGPAPGPRVSRRTELVSPGSLLGCVLRANLKTEDGVKSLCVGTGVGFTVVKSHVWTGSELWKLRCCSSGTRQNRRTVLDSCCCSEKFCREKEVKRECGTEREDNSSSSALLLVYLLFLRLLFLFLLFLLFHTFSARLYPLLRFLKILKNLNFVYF